MTSERPETRLWLHQVGIFSIIPNQGEGDCLFRSISQALSESPDLNRLDSSRNEENHSQIRKSVVGHIVNSKWSQFRNRILHHWKLKLEHERFRNAKKRTQMSTILQPKPDSVVRKEFAKRMSRCQECGTFYELLAAGDLYQFHVDYLTRIFPSGSRVGAGDTDDDTSAQLYVFFSCRTNGCNVSGDRPRFIFLYTRYSDGDGHWELLRPCFLLDPKLTILPLNRKLCGKIYIPDAKASPANYISKNQDCSLEDYIQIEAAIRQFNALLLSDDPEWPADSQDDNTGCAGEGFQPNLIVKQKKSRWQKFIRGVRRILKCKSASVHP